MKEVRGNNLLNAVRTALPNAGFVHVDPKSNGRKVSFNFRKTDFVVTSRLVVKELGFGSQGPQRLFDTQDTEQMQDRLRAIME